MKSSQTVTTSAETRNIAIASIPEQYFISVRITFAIWFCSLRITIASNSSSGKCSTLNRWPWHLAPFLRGGDCPYSLYLCMSKEHQTWWGRPTRSRHECGGISLVAECLGVSSSGRGRLQVRQRRGCMTWGWKVRWLSQSLLLLAIEKLRENHPEQSYHSVRWPDLLISWRFLGRKVSPGFLVTDSPPPKKMCMPSLVHWLPDSWKVTGFSDSSADWCWQKSAFIDKNSRELQNSKTY